ncbi:MAG: diguanylate cyclase [Trueperaceae bacterium]|nr:diguanylate cyclase [Trueperaceae bacterium]
MAQGASLEALRDTFERQRYAEALRDAERALDWSDACSDEVRELHRIALRSAFYLGDTELAQRHAMAGLRVARERNDLPAMAQAHNDLATLFGAAMLTSEALEHLWQSVHLRQRAGQEVDAATLNNLANVYLSLGQHDEAIGLLDRAIDRFRAHGDEASVALALANSGRAQVLAGRASWSIAPLDTALETFERLGRHGDVATTLAKLGVAHGAAGTPERARHSFERALALHEGGHAAVFARETHQGYGSWALEAGEAPLALEQLSAAAAAYDDADALARSGVMEPLSRALEAVGRPQDALAALRRHVEGQASLASATNDARVRVRLLELELGVAGEQEIAQLHALELTRTNRELRSEAQRLEQLSLTDRLTALPNRRDLDARLDAEVERSHRHDRPLVLALLDLDQFKAVNDRFSHDVGDQVLVRVGRLLREHLRANDVAARWGGEEFALLLPETDMDEAAVVLERVRSVVADADWSVIADGLSVTVSIGAASLAPGSGAADMLRQADRRLYAAKDAGRDRIVANAPT